MRQFGLPLAVALLGVVGCSNSLGITSPREIEANLVGYWSESLVGAQRASTSFSLTVTDTVVQGTGSWYDGVSTEGSLVVAGFISGSRVVLRIAQDNGTTLQYEAQMVSDHVLSGEFIDSGRRGAANYVRVITVHTEPL